MHDAPSAWITAQEVTDISHAVCFECTATMIVAADNCLVIAAIFQVFSKLGVESLSVCAARIASADNVSSRSFLKHWHMPAMKKAVLEALLSQIKTQTYRLS